MKNKKTEKSDSNRRNFLRLGVLSGVTAVTGMSLVNGLSEEEEKKSSGEMTKVLTPDGKLVEVPAESLNHYPEAHITTKEARKGIPNRKFARSMTMTNFRLGIPFLASFVVI